ncbi:hypothetical protein C8R45DRAFT_954867, partial [Mycena sanguinolenta]
PEPRRDSRVVSSRPCHSVYLPLELQREIFEIAILSSRSRDAVLKLNLSLVAHRVHFRVDSVFYEILKISGEESAKKFLRLVDLKPAGFFTAVVKTLFLFDPHWHTSRSAFPAARVLSVCGGVQSLAWWSGEMTVLPLSSASQIPLRRLSTRFGNIATLPAPSGWLSGITHLTLIPGLFTASRAPELKFLKHFPRLTHVALLVFIPDPSHADVVCDSCPNLQVSVITRADPNGHLAVANQFRDSRVVVVMVVMQFPPNLVEDWEGAHFGLPDIWTRAQDVLAERKRSAAMPEE